jgi:hypothetical protein
MQVRHSGTHSRKLAQPARREQQVQRVPPVRRDQPEQQVRQEQLGPRARRVRKVQPVHKELPVQRVQPVRQEQPGPPVRKG